MHLSTRAAALAAGLFWGGAMLAVGVVNMAAPAYGAQFLKVVASIYPGYEASGTLADVVVGTVYGIVDAAIGGWLFAWLYNKVAG